MNKIETLGLWAAYKALQMAQHFVSKNTKIKPFAQSAILLGINRAISIIDALRDNNPEDEKQIKSALIATVNQAEFDFLFDASIAKAAAGIKDPSLQLAAMHLMLNAKGAIKLLADENPDNEAQLKAFLAAYWKGEESTNDIMLALDGLLARVALKDATAAEILDGFIRAIISGLK